MLWKYEQGRKTLEELSGIPQSGPLTGPNAFAPGIDVFLKEHLFADIFGRGVLTYSQRELQLLPFWPLCLDWHRNCNFILELVCM